MLPELKEAEKELNEECLAAIESREASTKTRVSKGLRRNDRRLYDPATDLS
jgi:hypothetical protein